MEDQVNRIKKNTNNLVEAITALSTSHSLLVLHAVDHIMRFNLGKPMENFEMHGRSVAWHGGEEYDSKFQFGVGLCSSQQPMNLREDLVSFP